MMTDHNLDIQIFENSEFGKITATMIDGEEYFAATGCARILGYTNPQEAIRTHCKGVREILTPTGGGNQRVKFINEGDLYRLIVRSNLPAAKQFEKWVFDEVLPTLRKTGSYSIQKRSLVGNELILAGYAEAVKLIERQQTTIVSQQSQITADRPKVEFANAVGECSNGKGLREFAIALKQNGIVRNEHEFISWLLQRKYLYRNQKGALMPYAQFVNEAGYFWLKTVVTESAYGEKKERFQVKITGKGQQYLQQRLLK
jgi:anti-repressor protein